MTGKLSPRGRSVSTDEPQPGAWDLRMKGINGTGEPLQGRREATSRGGLSPIRPGLPTALQRPWTDPWRRCNTNESGTESEANRYDAPASRRGRAGMDEP